MEIKLRGRKDLDFVISHDFGQLEPPDHYHRLNCTSVLQAIPQQTEEYKDSISAFRLR